MTPTRLTVVYDALCGWCYGAYPLIAACAAYVEQQQAVGQNLSFELLHAGMFADDHATQINRYNADQYWHYDQRIQSLSQQPFSQTYYDQVLHGEDVWLNSAYSLLGAVIADAVSPAMHLVYLQQIQQMRYVDGLDTAKASVVLAALSSLSIPAELADFRQPALIRVAQHWQSQAQDRLNDVKSQAVPTFILKQGDQAQHLLHHADYGQPAQF
ncbi:MAG: hypothetical protein VXW65_03410, partial [Pseudomonadota bacterium]|nr:hypothetical protein [Pseudomonadota bacterium]